MPKRPDAGQSSTGWGDSFEAIRVKLLLAPKKQGIVTSYRSIRRKKKEEPAMARYMCLMGSDDGYETVQVPERKLATFGVDIARLEEWIEEDLTGQKRLPGLA
jgi:hypothetical protein